MINSTTTALPFLCKYQIGVYTVITNPRFTSAPFAVLNSHPVKPWEVIWGGTERLQARPLPCLWQPAVLSPKKPRNPETYCNWILIFQPQKTITASPNSPLLQKNKLSCSPPLLWLIAITKLQQPPIFHEFVSIETNVNYWHYYISLIQFHDYPFFIFFLQLCSVDQFLSASGLCSWFHLIHKKVDDTFIPCFCLCCFSLVWGRERKGCQESEAKGLEWVCHHHNPRIRCPCCFICKKAKAPFHLCLSVSLKWQK